VALDDPFFQSVKRTIDNSPAVHCSDKLIPYATEFPPMNRWAIFIRPLRGLGTAKALLSLPAHAILCVFQNYSAAREFLANLVAAREVAPASSLLTIVN